MKQACAVKQMSDKSPAQLCPILSFTTGDCGFSTRQFDCRGWPREKERVGDVDVDGYFSGEKEKMTRGKRRVSEFQRHRQRPPREEEVLTVPGSMDTRDGKDEGS